MTDQPVAKTMGSQTLGNRRFAGPGEPVDCTALVVTYNSAHDVGHLLKSLRGSTDQLRLRVVVIDNGSIDSTGDLIREHDDVVLVDAGGNLGYAGAINLGREQAGTSDAYLILNPDVVVEAGAIDQLWAAVREQGVGASVPRIVNEDGTTYHSIRREPSVLRAFGDAFLLGRFFPSVGSLSEEVRSDSAYQAQHPIDWATGAVMMIAAGCDQKTGAWDERFFLYSEETDYARRIRDNGYTIHYVPAARVMHRIGGSGGPSSLATLLAVNKVRYFDKFHGQVAARAFQAMTVLYHALRSNRLADRRTALTVARRSTWSDLPQARR